MKRKHYPAVTFAGASLLTMLPLVVLWFSLHGASSNEDIAIDVPTDPATNDKAIEDSTPKLASDTAITDTAITDTRQTQTRSEVPMTQAPAETIGSTQLADQLNAQPQFRLADTEIATPVITPWHHDVPAPVELPLEASELPAVNAFVAAAPQKESAIVSDSDMPELPRRPETDVTYYDATGHLAMRTQPQVPDPVLQQASANSSQKNTQKSSGAAGAVAGKKPKTKSRRSAPASEKTEEIIAVADSNRPFDKKRRGVGPGDVSGSLMEDVAIQTPLESAAVNRVENVVAISNARGWPVALIRSNLPDDVWWVQQMVGIQAQSFAARVNFGNEYSLSGSEYSLVIVFLDSPDEVRRFRIAKQFKEIPEGVRRSREFHYIRN
ncbi:MAG: hypothetical protein R3C17_00880 [Planctomycetaceae bacterium]